MSHDPQRLCHACGRRWQARSARRYTALGLRLRRAARHRGVTAAWAHPRPADRCPSCTSRDVGPGLPALAPEDARLPY